MPRGSNPKRTESVPLGILNIYRGLFLLEAQFQPDFEVNFRIHSISNPQASQDGYGHSGNAGYTDSGSGSGYSGSNVTVPSYNPGYSEPSQFESDSAGYPGGASENPSSSYYDYNYYDN